MQGFASPSHRFENPLDGAGSGHGKAHSSFDNPDSWSCANRRPVASNPGSRLGATARLPERRVVGSGRQRVPTVGGAGAAGLPERRLVGSGRQCVQAAACAVPTELRGRTILECGFQRLSAAWPGLGDGRRQVTTLGFSRLTPRSSSARSGGACTGVRSSRQRSAWVIVVYSHSQDCRLETPPIDRANVIRLVNHFALVPHSPHGAETG